MDHFALLHCEAGRHLRHNVIIGLEICSQCWNVCRGCVGIAKCPHIMTHDAFQVLPLFWIKVVSKANLSLSLSLSENLLNRPVATLPVNFLLSMLLQWLILLTLWVLP